MPSGCGKNRRFFHDASVNDNIHYVKHHFEENGEPKFPACVHVLPSVLTVLPASC
jgi:hypothetical protein